MIKNIRLLFVVTFSTFVFTNDIQVEVLEQNEEYVIISYIISDININEIADNEDIYHDINLKDEPNFIIKNSPKLPHVNRSLIIPELKYSMKVSIQSYEYKVYKSIWI